MTHGGLTPVGFSRTCILATSHPAARLARPAPHATPVSQPAPPRTPPAHQLAHPRLV